MNQDTPLTPLTKFLSVALFLLMFGLAVHSMGQISPTFDEQGFIVRGLGYVRGENTWMRVGHPLGLNALNALPLRGDERIQLPTEHPSWLESSFHRPAELFLWEIGNDVATIMFLARLPTVWLTMLLAATAARWAGELTRRRSASLLALAFLLLDPNVIAHGRLATTDLGLAAGALVSAYTMWRFLRKPGWGTALLAGVGLALLVNTKFTAGLFVPLFAIAILRAAVSRWRWPTPDRWRFTGLLLIFFPLSGVLALWGMYGFQIGTLPENLPTFSQLGGMTLPLSHYLEQLLDIGGRLQQETPAFLLGEHSGSGWWYYFPVALAVKTPLLLLAIYLGGTIYALLGRKNWPAAANWLLLLPPWGYFLFALTTDINLGYRHLLPMLPFLAVLGAAALSDWFSRRQIVAQIGLGLVVLWLGIVVLWIHPHYISYFNLLGGGPQNGWRVLVDSNIDWGQDLAGLARWQAENGNPQLWLSYFGEGRPGYYGIDYRGLDSFPPRLMNPAARPFVPTDPAPGIYAISATTLQGVHFADHDQFAYFRDREPVDKIGYSIFLYEVPARGAPVPLLLGGVQVDQITPADLARFNSNQLQLSWFDPQEAALALDGEYWAATATGSGVFPPETAVSRTETYTLYQLRGDAEIADRGMMLHRGPGAIAFLGVNEVPMTVVAGQMLSFNTQWRQQADPQPVKMFVHLLDADGEIAAQWDGLGLVPEGWRVGIQLTQRHTLDLPAQPGAYRLRAGLYDPETGVRWLAADGTDFVTLGTITLTEAEQ